MSDDARYWRQVNEEFHHRLDEQWAKADYFEMSQAARDELQDEDGLEYGPGGE
jgi:hypothetical protein